MSASDCYGIHNFVTDEGVDPVTGPAHCTECGAARIDPVRQASSASPFTCTICGHRVIEAHGPDETCFDCDELAQTGQYAPCSDPALDEDTIYERERERLLEAMDEAGVEEFEEAELIDGQLVLIAAPGNPEGDPTKNGALG